MISLGYTSSLLNLFASAHEMGGENAAGGQDAERGLKVDDGELGRCRQE